jgi:inner membrane protein
MSRAARTDLRAGTEDTRLTWDGRPLQTGGAFGDSCGGLELLRWTLGLEGPPAPDRAIAFTGATSLRGTGSFHLLTAARRTELSLAAPWPTPSFTGTGLPIRSEVTDAGLHRPLVRGRRRLRAAPRPHRRASPASTARSPAAPSASNCWRPCRPTAWCPAPRNYAAMFLALAFLTYALFELLARVRIHLVQYGLLGGSVVLFPLLLLAFGEPLGFAAAYAISAAAVAAQASAYTWAVTHRPRLAAIFAAVLATFFAFLYVVLSLESYALLTGAVALFAALSLVMVATRRVEWSRA